MSVLKIKDQNNDWIQIPTIKGDKGDPFTYADFTPEQLESLKGKDGISPTVSVASDTSDDYRLSFTDETHTVTTPNLIPEAEKILSVYPHDTASGAVASFPDGADDIPLKSCIVQIEPVQEGSGDPSPDNIRPITGWTGCEVQRTGKNLANAKYSNKVPSIINGHMVNVNGWSTEYIKVDNSKTYFASVGNDSTSYLLYYDSNFDFLGGRQFSERARVDTDSYFSGASYIKLRNDAAENNNPHIQLELSSTVTDYEPYQGETYPITFPTEAGTIYGGYVDVTGGELVIDKYYVSLGNSPSVTYHTGATPSIWMRYESGKGANARTSANAISNMYKIGGMVAPFIAYYGSEIDIFDDRFTDEATARSLLQDFICVYKLANPIHYPLTPSEIKTLLGQNNLWADTGDTEVEYRASTKMYIDRKITEAVAAALNS